MAAVDLSAPKSTVTNDHPLYLFPSLTLQLASNGPYR